MGVSKAEQQTDMPTVTHTTHSYDKHEGFEVEYTETSVFTTALSYRRGLPAKSLLASDSAIANSGP